MRGFLLLSGYNAICEALGTDAAPGRRSRGDAGACANALAKASRNAVATHEGFVLAARQYLASANAAACSVECHAAGYEEYDLGFRTRRHGDYLYVTEARQESRLKPGMRIAALGRSSVAALLKELETDVFWGRGTDREDWDLVLRMFDTVDVFPGDGSVMHMDLAKYPVQKPAPVMEARLEPVPSGGSAAVLRVDDLSDPAAVGALARKATELLQAGAERLVLDLRRCTGEADPASYLELFPLLVDGDVAARDLVPDREVYTVYSRNNVDLLLAGIERACQAGGDSCRPQAEQIAQAVRECAAEVLAAKRATHSKAERLKLAELPELVESPYEDELVRVSPVAPGQVSILLDATTGAGAERLAEAVMGMGRVRLVGRMTAGLVDYDNYVTVPLEGIGATFTYPMSRSAANHAGEGYAFRGLPLDVHVPFDPAECERDLVLEAALA